MISPVVSGSVLEFDCGPSVNTLKRFELDGNSNRFIWSGDAFEPRLLSAEKEDQRRRDIKNHLRGRRHSAQSSRSANRSPALQQTLRPRPGPTSRMFLDCTELHKASHVVGRRHSGRRASTQQSGCVLCPRGQRKQVVSTESSTCGKPW